MLRLRQFLALVLMVSLSFQVMASTLAELCRFECEQAAQSERIKTGSVREDNVVSRSAHNNLTSLWFAQSDEQAGLDMNCTGCSICHHCIQPVVMTLMPSVMNVVAIGSMGAFLAEPVLAGNPERPFKPPRA